MQIQNHHPHTEFQFDENGNLLFLEAKNFPGIGKQCQGELETKDYEAALIEAKFIEPVTKSDRSFKQVPKHLQQNRHSSKYDRRLSH